MSLKRILWIIYKIIKRKYKKKTVNINDKIKLAELEMNFSAIFPVEWENFCNNRKSKAYNQRWNSLYHPTIADTKEFSNFLCGIESQKCEWFQDNLHIEKCLWSMERKYCIRSSVANAFFLVHSAEAANRSTKHGDLCWNVCGIFRTF